MVSPKLRKLYHRFRNTGQQRGGSVCDCAVATASNDRRAERVQSRPRTRIVTLICASFDRLHNIPQTDGICSTFCSIPTLATAKVKSCT